MRRYAAWLLVSAGVLAGCTSFHTLPATPAAMSDAIEPGDTVRLRVVGSPEEVTVRVSSIAIDALHGRIRGGDDTRLTRIDFDHIEQVEIARPDVRKAMLTTILPVLIAAAIACQHQDCRTRAVIIGTQ